MSEVDKIVSFESYANNILAGANIDGGSAKPIEGVIYKGRSKFSLLCERDLGNGCQLFSLDTEPPTDQALQLIFDGGGRIQSLSQFDQLTIGQVGIASLKYRRSRSLRSLGEDGFLSFPYTDLASAESLTAHHNEIDLLNVFSGQTGGILLFENGGLPQEIGLLLDKKVKKPTFNRDSKDIRLGLLYMFHPSGSVHDEGMGSIDVFTSFLNQFSTQLTKPSYDMEGIEKILDSFKHEADEGLLTAQESVVWARAVAHSRLYDLTGDNRYLEFLHTYFPEEMSSRPSKTKFLRYLVEPNYSNNYQGVKLEYQPDLSKAAESLFIGNREYSDVFFQTSKEEDEDNKPDLGYKRAISDGAERVVRELSTKSLRSLRLAVDPYFLSDDNKMMVYLDDLGKVIKRNHRFRWGSGDNSVRNDIEVLLYELLQSSFSDDRFRGHLELACRHETFKAHNCPSLVTSRNRYGEIIDQTVPYRDLIKQMLTIVEDTRAPKE